MTIYVLKDDFITDNSVNPPQRYYLRELVDPYCAEYESSTLSDDQRRAMFEAIGAADLTAALERLFVSEKGYSKEDALRTIKLAQQRL